MSSQSFELTVNGSRRRLEASPDMPLLWVLRDRLGLKGTKYGCGTGLCGACTVHLDGKALRSCVVPLGAIGKLPVTTIEGLSAMNHATLRAWIEIDVPQCGYCQAGQIMSAAALLKLHPEPNDERIDVGMSGNICRCGTYSRIRRAIRLAAEYLQAEETGA